MAAETSTSLLPGGDTALDDRPSSPSPSTSPSLALDAVPLLDRSVSTPSSSTCSTQSLRSRPSWLSDGGSTVVRRRGYMRPQGTAFADSARNRDSVMSLGSIAHMQYYFARTGLLDGKGAQLAKTREKKLTGEGGKENVAPTPAISGDEYATGSLSLYDTNRSYAVSDPGQDTSVVESPTELTEASDVWHTSFEPLMLPPTVSTYKQKPSYTEPLPDVLVLRRELKEALQDACKLLEETQKPASNGQTQEEANGFYEIQGLHLLDIVTLAIRAAKNYYTAHTNPQKLYALKSERDIRSDLYRVLDVLKRMASRNFRGGMRTSELTDTILWIESIDQLLKREEQIEQAEAAEREAFAWREGDWTGREREREWLFLRSFDPVLPPLPRWPEEVSSPSADALMTTTTTLPSDFLKALQDGQRLVRLHNALVERSKRKFDKITTWHSDVAKPYRMAENLRYWIKAAELRWEVKLVVPVTEVIHGLDQKAWSAFDEAVFAWSAVVRRELTEEWLAEKAAEKKPPPELKVEVPEGANLGQQQEEEDVTVVDVGNEALAVDQDDDLTTPRSYARATGEEPVLLESSEAPVAEPGAASEQ